MGVENDYTEFEQGKDGDWRWHRRAGNNKNIAVPGEGFETRQSAEENYRRVRESFLYDAKVLPPGMMLAIFALLFLMGIFLGWLLWGAGLSEAEDETRTDRPTTVMTASASPTTATTIATPTSLAVAPGSPTVTTMPPPYDDLTPDVVPRTS